MGGDCLAVSKWAHSFFVSASARGGIQLFSERDEELGAFIEDDERSQMDDGVGSDDADAGGACRGIFRDPGGG
jgi:hypothetical protein